MTDVECSVVCATCRHYKHEDAPKRGRDGTCHRYAPHPLIGGSGTGWADFEWPEVYDNDYCGEWARRKYEEEP